MTQINKEKELLKELYDYADSRILEAEDYMVTDAMIHIQEIFEKHNYKPEKKQWMRKKY